MTVEEIRKLIEIGEPVSHMGHILDQELLKEMLEYSEKVTPDPDYERLTPRGGLIEQIKESATERKYEMLTGEMMKDMLERFQAEQEKDLIFGISGKAFPGGMETVFERPFMQVRPGVEVDPEDVPYDMEPQDYVEKVSRKIDEAGIVVSSGWTGKPTLVYIDPKTGDIEQKPIYVAGFDPGGPVGPSESEAKELLRKYMMSTTGDISVVNPIFNTPMNEFPGT